MATQRIKQEVRAQRAGILFAITSTVEAANRVAGIARAVASAIVAVIAPRNGAVPRALISATNAASQQIAVAAIYNSSASAYHRQSSAAGPTMQTFDGQHHDRLALPDIDRDARNPEDKLQVATVIHCPGSHPQISQRITDGEIASHL
jgi:hypothetical protein